MTTSMSHLSFFGYLLKKPFTLAYIVLFAISGSNLEEVLFGESWIGSVVWLLLLIGMAIPFTYVLNEISARYGLKQLPIKDGVFLQIGIILDLSLTVIVAASIILVPIGIVYGTLSLFTTVLKHDFSGLSELAKWGAPFLIPVVTSVFSFLFGIWHVATYSRGWVIRGVVLGNSFRAFKWATKNLPILKPLFAPLVLVILSSLLEIYALDLGLAGGAIVATKVVASLTYTLFEIWGAQRLLEYHRSFEETRTARVPETAV